MSSVERSAHDGEHPEARDDLDDHPAIAVILEHQRRAELLESIAAEYRRQIVDLTHALVSDGYQQRAVARAIRRSKQRVSQLVAAGQASDTA